MEVRRMNETNSKNKKGMSLKGQRTLAYIVLIIISFFCLFWFYVLFINATRSNGALKKGFTAIPGEHLIENWKNLLAGTLPVWNGQQYFHCYLLCCFMHLFFNNDSLRYPCI